MSASEAGQVGYEAGAEAGAEEIASRGAGGELISREAVAAIAGVVVGAVAGAVCTYYGGPLAGMACAYVGNIVGKYIGGQIYDGIKKISKFFGKKKKESGGSVFKGEDWPDGFYLQDLLNDASDVLLSLDQKFTDWGGRRARPDVCPIDRFEMGEEASETAQSGTFGRAVSDTFGSASQVVRDCAAWEANRTPEERQAAEDLIQFADDCLQNGWFEWGDNVTAESLGGKLWPVGQRIEDLLSFKTYDYPRENGPITDPVLQQAMVDEVQTALMICVTETAASYGAAIEMWRHGARLKIHGFCPSEGRVEWDDSAETEQAEDLIAIENMDVPTIVATFGPGGPEHWNVDAADKEALRLRLLELEGTMGYRTLSLLFPPGETVQGQHAVAAARPISTMTEIEAANLYGEGGLLHADAVADPGLREALADRFGADFVSETVPEAEVKTGGTGSAPILLLIAGGGVGLFMLATQGRRHAR